ncbi:P22 phage major capsid protein family protein [Glutamicibacter ardleyensis]|uniref:Bacteriophage protein n=1 Tax=Glutamicibacter ardleyensis TaxID=225894 RepID=A0ABQ2DF16_9MICC|nr:P22 phage major capsid protein family protein [Glutamicibacter ardleyensis]GGJ55722.1 bacteriophage protein [Glutamicibacter ardleyensis]
MAIENFIPELWSAAILEPFEQALVFAQPQICNRDYEGQIRQMGDTVNVTSVGAPTIRSYAKDTDLTFEDLTDTGAKLIIDQGDYFGFRVNDIDRTQAAGNFEGSGVAQAGTGLRDKVDKYIASLIKTNALTGNKLGDAKVIDDDPAFADAATQTTAYQVLIKLREKLDVNGVPTVGRYVVVNPEFVSALLMDKRYTDLSASGSLVPLLNGQVGRGAGFDVLVSNNLATVGGAGANKDYKVITAGVAAASSFAMQLTQVEAIREEKRFANIVRGLQVYGAKVFRPAGLATANILLQPRVVPTP